MVELPPGADLPVEEVTFTAGDGIQLAGWYAPSANGAVVILLHGYGGSRVDMLWHAQTLVKAGYGVMLYDERATGESGGAYRSYGWEDGPDVGSAITWIEERTGEPSPRIGIAGCSVGGQIALQGAIQYPEIAAVWADGPANLVAQDSPPPHNALSGLVLASNYLVDFLYVQHLQIPAPAPLVERIDRIAPRPVMLVGGGVQTGALGSEAPRVYRFASFAGPNAQVWVIPQAVHCDGPTVQPEEYARRLVQFFDDAFLINKG
jgi:pimeloyl-ACP methyl ester carboxylesterase